MLREPKPNAATHAAAGAGNEDGAWGGRHRNGCGRVCGERVLTTDRADYTDLREFGIRVKNIPSPDVAENL